MRPFLFLALALAGLVAAAAHAETAPFDLAGPSLRVTVTQGGVTLPIANVPQLAAGDRLAVAADLPADQSARYLLIAAFLRGSTNPPPASWFFHAPTWTKKGRAGLVLTVPPGAQQIALFLAPATGGDFSTLRNAVSGRPGAFVRATQELAQAALDRARLDAYLSAIRAEVPGDPGRLERITPLLARSLQVKINPDCLAKLPELQAPCLLQNQEALVLNDGHSNAITDMVAGPGTDLALQFSATPQGGLGAYSPYIAAIRDIIGILSSIHTAKYQYLPAIGLPDGDRLRLVLNAPPSFHNPKSVLVTALPIVAPVHVPPLQLVDADPLLCAQAPAPLLAVSGAPLLFATRYAHDLGLAVTLPDGARLLLPVVPDAARGGLVVQTGRLPPAPAGPLTARLQGRWGFLPFNGPAATLVSAREGQWRLDMAEAAGSAPGVALVGGVAACVTGVAVEGADGSSHPVAFAVRAHDSIGVMLPAADRGARALLVTGPAAIAPERLALPSPPPRFSLGLIGRSIVRPPAAGPVTIDLGDQEGIPADAAVTVSLRAGRTARFTGHEVLEIAPEFGARSVMLDAATGLTIADAQVALARFVPRQLFGPSAYGQLRARVVRDGVAGDWLALGMLVRLPALRQLTCPIEATRPCLLAGEELFLLSAIGASPDFTDAVPVADGFPGTQIEVPHPPAGGLYLRLHDDAGAPARLIG